MRVAAIVGLVLFAACGDPGPRDRSSFGLLQAATAAELAPTNRRVAPAAAVIGLASDPLAPLYPDAFDSILRVDDLATLERTAGPAIAEARRAHPLPFLPEKTLYLTIRASLDLPEGLEIDPSRPFGILRIEGRTVALLPAPGAPEGERVRRIENGYVVAGDAETVRRYVPCGRKGYYLPGVVSARISPERARPWLLACGLPDDFERVDVAARTVASSVRVDLRLAPRAGSPSAATLDRLRPVPPLAARHLPPNLGLYLELTAPALSLENLLLGLPEGAVPQGDWSDGGSWAPARKALAAFAGETAVGFEFPRAAAGAAFLVTMLDDPKAAREFLGSAEFRRLLARVAGEDGHLEWMPGVFDVRGGLPVGAVTGYVGRGRLNALRDGTPAERTLATLLRGPAVAYVAIADARLGIVVGQRARPAAERFFERMLAGQSAENDHTAEVTGLLDQRVFALTADLPSLLEGLRECAPFWHPRGERLREIEMRLRCPIAIAATVEGGSLRLALRFGGRSAASFLGRLIEALR